MRLFEVAGKPHDLLLPPALDFAAAAPLAAALLEHLGDDVTLDGSRVQRMGASCLQVLLSARRTWAKSGVSLSLAHASERMVADLHCLGFELSTFLNEATLR